MMGHTTALSLVFYYFRLEDQVPRLICYGLSEKTHQFCLLRERLKQSYSEPGVRR